MGVDRVEIREDMEYWEAMVAVLDLEDEVADARWAEITAPFEDDRHDYM